MRSLPRFTFPLSWSSCTTPRTTRRYRCCVNACRLFGCRSRYCATRTAAARSTPSKRAWKPAAIGRPSASSWPTYRTTSQVIDAMYELIDKGTYDVVNGSRYMRGGRQIGGPPLKTLLSRTAGLSLHALSGIPTHDATNNFKMYRGSFLSRDAHRVGGRFRSRPRTGRQSVRRRLPHRRSTVDLARSRRRRIALRPAQVDTALSQMVSLCVPIPQARGRANIPT